MKKTVLCSALLAAFCLAGTAQAASANAVPSFTQEAEELSRLPGGGWLLLDKHGLRLFNAAGQEQDRIAVRAKQLDTRSDGNKVLAVFLEADTQRPLPVSVDVQAGKLVKLAPFPVPTFSVEASCLYRDAQQLAHLFLIGKDGQAEQWVMQGEQRSLVRKLALPPHAKHCRVDDGAQRLLVSESNMGVWAYDAESEGMGKREVVALRKPYGQLDGGAGALAMLPGGVAVLDGKAEKLHLYTHQGSQWTAMPPQAVALNVRKGDSQLALDKDSLLLRGKNGWQTRPLKWAGKAETQPAVAIIAPQAQTEPMARQGDAADDPAIWLSSNPADARILGTNKKQGLLVYDLQGKQTQLLEVGRLNNVDVRQNIQLGSSKVDLAVATQRDDNSMMLFTINAHGVVAEAGRFPTGLKSIYGMCLYQPASGGVEAFINDKDGTFQQYSIGLEGNKFTATLLRSFKVATQPEGCVADDANARLFLGEETRGIWTTSADAAKPDALTMVLPVGANLTADVEGMAIYRKPAAKPDTGYLIVSSQGDSSYVVLDAQAPYAVRGRFKVGFNLPAGIDGTSETDGLDVTSANLGGAYAQGMLVIQDGYKRLPDGPQNFKYVAWGDVAKALKLD
ncbi:MULTISPECIES: phytase [unclassified Janthinobacterium]|uniref:phytase n=1 Tax=unclassified Janthinobacterium TaxID=2610881 RepID=UPI0025AF9FC0|nr:MULTISPECIES: phytase [unclassified Janthinobacterium]MDN2701029.1 phytase [Janthinobacterium sp. SUN100]MDO8039730.1 phytase [Janthinobacterium sp. SUN137]